MVRIGRAGIHMQIDRHIAVWAGWVAGPAFGVAMMAAPEYLKLQPYTAALFFWGGIFVFLATIFVVIVLSAREQGRRHKAMWPIVTMAVGVCIFGVGAAAYFWPSADATRIANIPERREQLSDDIRSVLPLIEALRKSQGALAESEQTRDLLGKATSQFDQLQSGIAAQERFTGDRRVEERLAAAEHIIQELKIILGNVRSQSTPRGTILIIKIAPNSFRVTFAVPMRISPKLDFQGLPDGATPSITEHSALGFSVVFTPATVPVEHFGFTANAEL